MRTRYRAVLVCLAAVTLVAGAVVSVPPGNTAAPRESRQAAPAAQPQSAPKPAPGPAKKPASPPAEKTAAEAFKNIQVLKDVPASQLMPAMFFIAASLGVACDHCHVTAEHGPWPLEKDDKKEKSTAREMMKMMRGINDQFFAGKQEVNCTTCHQGHAEPVSFTPVLVLGTKSNEEEETPGQLPTVDQILDKYVEALGGAPALARLTTRMAKGTLVGESGRSYQLEIMEQAPDRMLVTIAGPKGSTTRFGFDGTTAWNGSDGSVFETSGLERARLLRDYQFFAAADLKVRYPRRFVAGTGLVGGEEAYVVRAGGPGDVSEKLYFSVKGGLLLRRIAYTRTPLGRLSEQTDYSDYRETDGVQIPFTVRRMEINTRWTESYTEAKHNVAVEDAAFQRPAGTK